MSQLQVFKNDMFGELPVIVVDGIEWFGATEAATALNGYLYLDAMGKLNPYAKHVPGLFELKEWERNGKADTQTLVTPKGRETFRLLLASAKAV